MLPQALSAGMLGAAQKLQQRRLAGAVAADDAVARQPLTNHRTVIFAV